MGGCRPDVTGESPKGNHFHNGTPLTATLAATILREAVARPSNRAQFTSLSDVRDVRPDGDLQLVFELSRLSSSLPEDLELPLEIGQPSVGTGAYRILKREPTEIVLAANERYYLGAPRIQQVMIRPFVALRRRGAAFCAVSRHG